VAEAAGKGRSLCKKDMANFIVARRRASTSLLIGSTERLRSIDDRLTLCSGNHHVSALSSDTRNEPPLELLCQDQRRVFCGERACQALVWCRRYRCRSPPPPYFFWVATVRPTYPVLTDSVPMQVGAGMEAFMIRTGFYEK
jgi:hypothetical protein